MTNTQKKITRHMMSVDHMNENHVTLKTLPVRLNTLKLSSVQSLSHVQLCDPMDCSTPGLPVHHQLLEFTQTQVH